MSINSVVRATKLDKIFGTPVCAVLLAILCNILWGSAFPFIKLGYRLFSIDPANTASIFCFAGVRFMLGSVLVLLGSILLQGHAPHFPRRLQNPPADAQFLNSIAQNAQHRPPQH